MKTAHPVDQVVIGTMAKEEMAAVVAVLARALRDNPQTVAMFGSDAGRRLQGARTIYALLLSTAAEPPFVARLDGRIVGAAALSPPETCYFRRARANVRRIRIAGREVSVETPPVPWRHVLALLRLGLAANRRIATMADASAAHDPATRHWHVELVGVEPELQGRGIGGMLMEAVLGQVDAAGGLAYLETDTPDNVAFYRRRRFAVIAEEESLGIRMWYMERAIN